MGILHSFTRFLGSKTEDEGLRGPLYHPYPLHHEQDHGDSSDRKSVKIFNFHILIFKAIKGILQKFRFISYLPRPGKKADPILPVQNPAPTLSTSDDDPSLVQPLIVSDSSSDYSTTEFSPVADSGNLDVVSSENNSITNRNQMDCVIISIPDKTHSIACTNASQEIVDSLVVTEESLHMGMGVNSSEEDVIIKSKVVVVEDEGIRWITHYSSRHRILLVGEGDFSFSACLALAFGRAPNIIATSLNSKAFLKENYKNAVSNIKNLKKRGSRVIHGIDATKMSDDTSLRHLKFDRIIFNFPFAGFFKDMPRKDQLRRHRKLVSQFLKNAKEIMSEDGEIHISHKTNGFHSEWNLVSIASSRGLGLIEAVDFNRDEYPGYNTKYGFGGDNNFDCNPAKTYKFRPKTLSYMY